MKNRFAASSGNLAKKAATASKLSAAVEVSLAAQRHPEDGALPAHSAQYEKPTPGGDSKYSMVLRLVHASGFRNSVGAAPAVAAESRLAWRLTYHLTILKR